MRRPKTHFEQVPLETVRKIIEEQNRRETTAEQTQEIKKPTSEDQLFRTQQQ
jgi:hypothetical protein